MGNEHTVINAQNSDLRLNSAKPLTQSHVLRAKDEYGILYSYKQNLRQRKLMLSEAFSASLLLACMVCFFAANIRNILTTRRTSEKTTEPHVEVEMPSGFIVNLAAFGTFIYFIAAFTYVALVIIDRLSWVGPISLLLPDQIAIAALVIGSAFTVTGYAVFIWSVIARGRYATSWEMHEDHRLVTWGPYKHVRHPSYLAYFLMFLGLFILWPSLITLIPIAAVPSYVLVTYQEERHLEKRFGEEYEQYRKKTRRFLPKF
jgi:protein-S-isoprenylcysteine O-methyltransferase Ste14